MDKPALFSWRGVGGAGTNSMGIVDRENCTALTALGWQKVDPESAGVNFSFAHQGTLQPDTSGAVRVAYVCTTTHNSLVKTYVSRIQEFAACPSHYVFVLNRTMQENFAAAEIPTSIWHHGVDTQFFSPHPRPQRPLRLGFVGQFEPFKRPEFLIDVFKAARASVRDKQVELLMVIPGPRSGLPRFDVNENIRILEGIKREWMPLFYRSIDCLVTFSYAEGYNLPPLEALACGIPCIVPDMPEMHEDPYDALCAHVPATRVVNTDILGGQDFAPRNAAVYLTQPWVHEVGFDDAVDAVSGFLRDPVDRRLRTFPTRYGWGARIESEVLPVIAGGLGRFAFDHVPPVS